MAKVTLTLTDNDDGTVHMAVKLDPPIDTDDDAASLTPAQSAVMVFMDALAADSDEQEKPCAAD